MRFMRFLQRSLWVALCVLLAAGVVCTWQGHRNSRPGRARAKAGPSSNDLAFSDREWAKEVEARRKGQAGTMTFTSAVPMVSIGGEVRRPILTEFQAWMTL